MKHFALASLPLAVLAAACQQMPAAPPSEAAAATVADDTQAAWVSQDADKIKARYAEGIVMFDPMVAPLATDQATFNTLQDAFAAMKFDALTVPERKIQILDADTFIVSGSGTLTSKEGALKQADMRFTTVYQRQKDGSWLIVNEHVSMTPQEAG